MVEKAILFFTVAMLPVFILFLAAPPLLIGILYQGKYLEAIPTLQVFSLLALIAPLLFIGTNVLMGLGEARLSFVLGAQMLGISLVCYLVLIPLLRWNRSGTRIRALFLRHHLAYRREDEPVHPGDCGGGVSAAAGYDLLP